MQSPLRRTFSHACACVCAAMVMMSAGAAASRLPATTVVGTVWKADKKPIPNAKLRLRNVITGSVQATTVADSTGQFLFTSIESGSYIVELISDRGSILAVGPTVTAGPGETAVTFVRLGSKVPWFEGFFGNAASAVAAAAASTGITAMAPEDMQCASPPCGRK
jgi:hypothetical protein